MKLPEIRELFEKHDDEYGRFERIADPPSQRPDLCAFLKLDQVCPGKTDIVIAAEHDQIYLGVDLYDYDDDGVLQDVLPNLTEGDIIYLRRCGVALYGDTCSFSMFV